MQLIPENIVKRNYLNDRGQVAVTLALVFPLFILLLAFFVNMGLLIHQKMRIQNAVDAGVYSSSASLARDLNRIARYNLNIKELYDGDPSDEEISWDRSLEAKLDDDSHNGFIPMFLFTFQQYQNKYHEVLDRIVDISDAAYRKADRIGEEAARLTFYNGNEPLANVNPNDFTYENLYKRESLMDYQEFTDWKTIDYMKNSCGDTWDPCDGHTSYSQFVNLPIRKTSMVKYVAKAEADTGFVNLLSRFYRVAPKHYEKLSPQIRLRAYAAGQPYSGAVESFFNTYRASLVPLRSVTFSSVDEETGEVITGANFWH